MKDESGNIKQYNSEDIRRYVQDEMSPGEMHAIERAALDDPFLADALEGYLAGIADKGLESMQNSAANLQSAFTERIKDKKKRNVVPVVRMKWWQGAVAAAIILTAGVLGYRSYTDRADELLLTVNETRGKSGNGATIADSAEPAMTTGDYAQSATNQGDSTTAPTEQDAKSQSRSGTTTAPATGFKDEDGPTTSNSRPAPPVSARANNSQSKDRKSRQPVRLTEDEASLIKDSSLIIRERSMATNARDNAKRERAMPATQNNTEAVMLSRKPEESALNNETVAGAHPDSSAARSTPGPEPKLSGKVAGVDFESNKTINKNLAAVNYFNGQIVTSDNKPLSNAVLKLNNNATIYTTDNNGKFRIASPDSVIEVEASMVGRETTRFRLQKNDEANNLVLAGPDNEMSEVVVIGYGNNRKKALTGSVAVSRREAEPEGGWLAWENYLQANKDTTLTLNGTAETELRFQVTSKNKLSQFRVIRSVSDKHDREVIRLIKEGPKWKLLKGKKSTVTVTMRF
ncbi:MAG: hypothetical protein EOO04_03720 [Chitinophagaceae bacterium]|nr:MAG: hypothetical protein EOO04_03720 [Chitinophagaceae bacterium]